MAAGGAKRVFIIDDSEDLLESLEMVLTDRLPGIGIETFQQARRALDKAVQDPPQLVVTDYFMPDMDGLDLAEKLLSARPDVPIMIISGYLDDKLQARMKRLPNIKATQHKPLKLADFVAAVRKLMGS